MTPLTDKAQLDILQCGRPAKVKAEFAAKLELKLAALSEFVLQPDIVAVLTPAQLARLDALLTDTL